MSKYHFREGEEVSHKDNLNQKMTISRILKESVKVNRGFDEKKGQVITGDAIRMIGIECHWWQTSEITREKALHKNKFHSNELVPIDVANKGQEAVREWLREQS